MLPYRHVYTVFLTRHFSEDGGGSVKTEDESSCPCIAEQAPSRAAKNLCREGAAFKQPRRCFRGQGRKGEFG